MGKGRGILGVCDRAGRRSVTRLQRKVAVTGESLPRCCIGRRTFPLAMRESGRQEGKFADRGLPIDAPHTNRAQTALSRPTRALCVANDASREHLRVPGPPLTHPVFEPATSARPATGTTCVGATASRPTPWNRKGPHDVRAFSSSMRSVPQSGPPLDEAPLRTGPPACGTCCPWPGPAGSLPKHSSSSPPVLSVIVFSTGPVFLNTCEVVRDGVGAHDELDVGRVALQLQVTVADRVAGAIHERCRSTRRGCPGRCP